MIDPVHRAVICSMEHGGPEKVWKVGADAHVQFGSGRNPFHGMTVTTWPEADDDRENAA